jgi:hypothetical protein
MALSLFLLLLPIIEATYSIHYYAGISESKIVNTDSTFVASPDAIHVADIYARISGLTPLLSEGDNFL